MATNFETFVRRKVKRQVGMRPLLSKHGRARNMAWIETHQTLIHHRKTNRAIALLKCNRYKFVGHMIALWLWALDQAPFGNFGDLLPAEIADAAGWDPAKGEAFVNVLVTVGFIDEDGDDGMKLHNWEKYTGLLMARREAGRKGGIASGVTRRAKQNGDVLEANANGASTPTSPHLTNQTNKTVPTALPPNYRALLDLTPLEIQKLRSLFPNADINARHRDWVSWIEEEARRGRERMPDDKMAAFHGWLKKDDGHESSAAAAVSILERFAR